MLQIEQLLVPIEVQILWNGLPPTLKLIRKYMCVPNDYHYYRYNYGRRLENWNLKELGISW